MCKYCNRKPVFDSTGHYELWNNKETVATGAYSSLDIGVDASGKLIMIGGGDDDTEPYYPKYCPECGRKLTSSTQEAAMFKEYICGITGVPCCGCSACCEHRKDK